MLRVKSGWMTAVVAGWAVVGLASAAIPQPCRADSYMMDGKPISKEQYDAGILINDGSALLHSNRNQEAAAKFKQAVDLTPNFADAHHDYALAMARLGNLDLAIAEFKKAIELNPLLDSAWLSLGSSYQSSGMITEALATYKEYLKRFPNARDVSQVSSLIEGLDHVQQSHKVASATADDYFAEATSGGATRWPAENMPIKVFVYSGTNVAGFKPKYDEVLRNSFEDWAKVSQGLIKFRFVDDPKDCDIECTWVSDGTSLANQAESGETRLTKTGKGIVHARIQLVTVPTLPGLPMTANRMRMICLHEIGHALGFTGHTTNPKDAMFYSCNLDDNWKDLSARDVNTLMHLYSGPTEYGRG